MKPLSEGTFFMLPLICLGIMFLVFLAGVIVG
jgi:hypothetical protein